MYSYFRYTGSLFLGCALFVVRCNIIRASRETKKERSSFRKKNIEVLVWGISLFLQQTLISMSFYCFLRLLPSPSQVTQFRNDPYKWYSVWWYHEWTVEIMKISYNLILYAFFYKQLFFLYFFQKLQYCWSCWRKT